MNCQRCGGSTKGQNVLDGIHRHKDDCIAHLRLALKHSTVMQPKDKVEFEVVALEKWAKDYDTVRQSSDTCLAAGAHDALRWALGLAEQSISEVLGDRDAEADARVETWPCNECGLPCPNFDDMCEKCQREQVEEREWELLHPELRCPPRE